MTAEERLDLLRRAKAGDEGALDRFVEENFGLVHMAARRFQGRGTDYDDLFQIGCVGLCKAVKNFDLTAGVVFSTYAVPVIFGELKRYFRDTGMIKISRSIKERAARVAAASERLAARLGREPTVSELTLEAGLTAEEVTEALDSMQPVMSLHAPVDGGEGELTLEGLIAEDETVELCDVLTVREAIGRLSPREREVVRSRFFQNRTQQATADRIGISQVQVSRIEKKVVEKLRGEMLAT